MLYAGVSVYAKSRCRYSRLSLLGREPCSAHAAESNLTVRLQVKALQSDQLALLAIATVSAHLDTFLCFFETLDAFSPRVQPTLGRFVWLLRSLVSNLFCASRKHSPGVIPVGSISHVLFADICSYFPDDFEGDSGIMCPAATSTGVGICPDVPAGQGCTSANGQHRQNPAAKHSMSNLLLSCYVARCAYAHQLAAAVSLPVIHSHLRQLRHQWALLA